MPDAEFYRLTALSLTHLNTKLMNTNHEMKANHCMTHQQLTYTESNGNTRVYNRVGTIHLTLYYSTLDIVLQYT